MTTHVHVKPFCGHVNTNTTSQQLLYHTATITTNMHPLRAGEKKKRKEKKRARAYNTVPYRTVRAFARVLLHNYQTHKDTARTRTVTDLPSPT